MLWQGIVDNIVALSIASIDKIGELSATDASSLFSPPSILDVVCMTELPLVHETTNVYFISRFLIRFN